MADNEEHDEITQLIKQSYTVPPPSEELVWSLAARARQELGPALRQKSRVSDRLRQRILEVFGRTQTEKSLRAPRTRSLVNWRWMMRSSVSRVAAAVVFVLAIAGVALWFHLSETQVAFADFIKPFLEAKSTSSRSLSSVTGSKSGLLT